MKLTQYLVITNPEKFARGNYDCLSLFDHKPTVEKWIVVKQIEIDIDVDHSEVVKSATDTLNEEIATNTAMNNVLEQRKAELLCLPAPE
jgi:hypothetical protein